MQYILSKEEYDALVNAKVGRAKMADKKLQKLCTEICNTMPVKWGWGSAGSVSDLAPWTCIHSHEGFRSDWYCDQCPVKEICPEPNKNWSK